MRTRHRFVPIIEGMIASEIIRTFTAVLVILSSIVVSHSFIKILAKSIEGNISSDAIFILFGFKLFTTIATLLSPSIFLSILMVLGRMYRDFEMDALAASGAGATKIYRSVFVVVIPLSGLAAILSLQILPWSERQRQALMVNEGSVVDVKNLVAGRFSQSENGDFAFYIDKIDDDGKLWKIFVQNRKSGVPDIITSESGFETESVDGRFVVLENGVRVQGAAGQANLTITEFDQYGVQIQRPDQSIAESKLESAPSSALWRSDLAVQIGELQVRLAIPFGIICLSAWAIPLAKTYPRGGIYGNVLMAFLIYVTYANLLKILRVWVSDGTVAPWFAFFGVYTILLLGTAFSLSRSLGGRWIISRIKSISGL